MDQKNSEMKWHESVSGEVFLVKQALNIESQF